MSLSTGYLKLVLGPMFAGKSSFLIEEISKFDNTNNILAIKHSFDKRYSDDDYIISHDQKRVACKSVEKLSDILDAEILANKQIIFIDEAQFFEDIYETVIILVEEMNKHVYLAGLDGDFRRIPFCNSKLLNLIPLADEVIKLRGTCGISGCVNPSIFSHRTSTSNDQVVVGNCYIPLCRTHFLNTK
jgi:thymidine kinase